MPARQRPIPFDLGPVHFIGIGGIGMSGLAEIMLTPGLHRLKVPTCRGSAQIPNASRLSGATDLSSATTRLQNVSGASSDVVHHELDPLRATIRR